MLKIALNTYFYIYKNIYHATVYTYYLFTDAFGSNCWVCVLILSVRTKHLFVSSAVFLFFFFFFFIFFFPCKINIRQSRRSNLGAYITCPPVCVCLSNRYVEYIGQCSVYANYIGMVETLVYCFAKTGLQGNVKVWASFKITKTILTHNVATKRR